MRSFHKASRRVLLLGPLTLGTAACAQTLPTLDEYSPGHFFACIRKDLMIATAP